MGLFLDIVLLFPYSGNNIDIFSHCIFHPSDDEDGDWIIWCDAVRMCHALIIGTRYDMECDPYQFIFWLLVALVIHADLKISLHVITDKTDSWVPQVSCHVTDTEGPSVFKEKPELKSYDQGNWIIFKLIWLVQHDIFTMRLLFHLIRQNVTWRKFKYFFLIRTMLLISIYYFMIVFNFSIY